LRLLGYATVTITSLAAWWVMSEAFQVIPSPFSSLAYAASNYRVLAGDALVTLGNTMAGFALGALLAVATAAAALAGGRARSVVEAVNVVVQSVSALVWAILFLLLFGVTSRLPAVGVAAATAYPILLSGALKGFEVLRSEYGDLVGVLRMSRLQELRYVLVPGSIPFLVAAGRSALGAALRISVVAEALGAGGGLGYRIWTYYQLHNYEGLFSWALALVALMILVDKLALERVEEWGRRWAG